MYTCTQDINRSACAETHTARDMMDGSSQPPTHAKQHTSLAHRDTPHNIELRKIHEKTGRSPHISYVYERRKTPYCVDTDVGGKLAQPASLLSNLGQQSICFDLEDRCHQRLDKKDPKMQK